MLILVAALFNHDLHQIDILAAYLHSGIDGEAHMDPPLGYEREGSV